MSKTSKTGTTDPVAVLKFATPASSSRTLNASEAYDTQQTYYLLGSYVGTLTDQGLRTAVPVLVSSESNQHPSYDVKQPLGITGLKGVTLGISSYLDNTVKGSPGCDTAGCHKAVYTGVSSGGFSGSNSKVTNPVTIYDGVILLGVGGFKKYQGKNAVLKSNSDTGKSILRIYDA
jgi:hypothetical protein